MKSKVIFTGLFSLLLLAGCQPNQTTTPSSTTNQSSETTVTSTNKSEDSSTFAGSTDSSSSQTATPDIQVSADRAIELFLNKYPDAAITSLELDSDWGSYFYKIEGVDDQNEYSVKINAMDEKLEAENPEQLDRDEQNGQKKSEDGLDVSNLISIEEAGKIAVEKVGAGTATDWDLDKELGTTYWDVKVKNGNQTTNVKINSQTGEVLSSEIDD
ncbi:PepSY domain-containing protein [Enterococcus mundtii]|uniref:PepSY domain-containing protein n=1 Tax=Enterococcus TaxID=1350 RepID=UPI000F7CFAD8|nr:PepSY domain-containing protein [Enterococcus mundtii]AZP92864.1 lysis protein [Enterococcus mundtii]MDA9428908.1 putative lipoprotein [Enterococcus mundtii 1A]MDK4211986.1 PepSY domain-containing protein [Enterococcus mundtii]MEC3940104.1 PepSY domain-containing protein [Enterococcus mundtii]